MSVVRFKNCVALSSNHQKLKTSNELASGLNEGSSFFKTCCQRLIYLVSPQCVFHFTKFVETFLSICSVHTQAAVKKV
jgi:hypothetical protein